MKNQQTLKDVLKKPIVIIALLAFVLYSVFFNNDKPTQETQEPKKESIAFDKMTYEQKQVFIEDYLQHTDDTGYEIMTDIRNEIKKQFNYPKTVKFDWNSQPVFDNAKVVEADSGWVNISGKGSAQNAFKQQSEFYYNVKLKITDKEIGILNVKVNK